MKVRNRRTGVYGYSDHLNTASSSEIIVHFEDGDASSEYIVDYDVQLPDGRWTPLREAFAAHDVVPDNWNQGFASPRDTTARERGWND